MIESHKYWLRTDSEDMQTESIKQEFNNNKFEAALNHFRNDSELIQK